MANEQDMLQPQAADRKAEGAEGSAVERTAEAAAGGEAPAGSVDASSERAPRARRRGGRSVRERSGEVVPSDDAGREAAGDGVVAVVSEQPVVQEVPEPAAKTARRGSGQRPDPAVAAGADSGAEPVRGAEGGSPHVERTPDRASEEAVTKNIRTEEPSKEKHGRNGATEGPKGAAKGSQRDEPAPDRTEAGVHTRPADGEAKGASADRPKGNNGRNGAAEGPKGAAKGSQRDETAPEKGSANSSQRSDAAPGKGSSGTSQRGGSASNGSRNNGPKETSAEDRAKGGASRNGAEPNRQKGAGQPKKQSEPSQKGGSGTRRQEESRRSRASRSAGSRSEAPWWAFLSRWFGALRKRGSGRNDRNDRGGRDARRDAARRESLRRSEELVKSFESRRPGWAWPDYVIHVSVVVLGVALTLGVVGVFGCWRTARQTRASMQLVYDELKENRAELAKVSASLLLDRQGLALLREPGRALRDVPADSLAGYADLFFRVGECELRDDALSFVRLSGMSVAGSDGRLLREVAACYARLEAFQRALDSYNGRKTLVRNHLVTRGLTGPTEETDPVALWGRLLADPVCAAFVATSAGDFASGLEETPIGRIDRVCGLLSEKYGFE